MYRVSSHRRINLIWFGYIARLSQRGGEGYLSRSSDFYLPSLLLEGGGGQHPVWQIHNCVTPHLYVWGTSHPLTKYNIRWKIMWHSPLNGYYLECGTSVSSAWLTGSWSILLRLVSRLADSPVTCQANTTQLKVFDLKEAWECDIRIVTETLIGIWNGWERLTVIICFVLIVFGRHLGIFIILIE